MDNEEEDEADETDEVDEADEADEAVEAEEEVECKLDGLPVGVNDGEGGRDVKGPKYRASVSPSRSSTDGVK